MLLGSDEPLAVAATDAIQRGDLDALRHLLADHPGLASATIGDHTPGGMSRSLLHAATDWPGHFPNNVATVRLLIEHGADVHARFTGPHTETPLHWAASSDDVEVLDALLDAGADIEADGAVIARGHPDRRRDCVRTVERGATAGRARARTNLYESASMGLLDRLHDLLDQPANAGADAVTRAFWGACAGGQLAAAQLLAHCGADVYWVSVWDGVTPLQAARRSRDEDLARPTADRQTDRQFAETVEWLESLPRLG